MNSNPSAEKPKTAAPIRWVWISGILLLLGLAGWIGLAYAADADEIARLRHYSPRGHHYIDTALTGGSVKWTSREIAVWKVRKGDHELPSVDEFKFAFLKRAPNKKANISVHHPALNLEKEAGRQSNDRTEEILAFLEENGYENAGVVAN